MNQHDFENFLRDEMNCYEQSNSNIADFNKSAIWEAIEQKTHPTFNVLGCRISYTILKPVAAALIPLLLFCGYSLIHNHYPNQDSNTYVQLHRQQTSIITLKSKNNAINIAPQPIGLIALSIEPATHKIKSSSFKESSSKQPETNYSRPDLVVPVQLALKTDIDSYNINGPLYKPNALSAMIPPITMAQIPLMANLPTNYLRQTSNANRPNLNIAHLQHTMTLAMQQPTKYTWAKWAQNSSAILRVNF